MNLPDMNGLDLVPEPQEITVIGPAFAVSGLTADRSGLDGDDRFALDHASSCFEQQTGLSPNDSQSGLRVVIARANDLPPEGYSLEISPAGVSIKGRDSAGTYYALQTLLQCMKKSGGRVEMPSLKIRDWPDVKYRAMHYDTKHHQGTREAVELLIRDLASYKANVLVWEWEDKFAYRKHPDIGAPGAFSMEEMQALTRYAQKHHVQIVPLVQGLGHVSFILKHRQYDTVREIPDSNWEVCPLKEETYELLFDLFDEAIEATPRSEFLHIGSDETYDFALGEECGCRKKAEEIGRDGLMQIFIRRCVEHGESKGRKVLSWGGAWKEGAKHQPPKSMIWVDEVGCNHIQYFAAAKQAGYPVWAYARNPETTPLFVQLFPWVKSSMWTDGHRASPGNLAQSAEILVPAAQARLVDGTITTSWEDCGLHILCWMPRFIFAADCSWKGSAKDIDVWADRYFRSYFGPESLAMRELFEILQESSLFYHDTFQRRVWHWGDIGKIHVPDFPREELEYNNFWRKRYGKLVEAAQKEKLRVLRALRIIDDNLARGVRHSYDLEVFRTGAELMRHNTDLIIMLGQLEEAIATASDKWHFGGEVPAKEANRKEALKCLRKAEELVEEHLADRRSVFENLVQVWERTRLPKGLSLPGKPYKFEKDRARHLANRTPGMEFLIIDEQLLDLEGYLRKLKIYNLEYRKANRL